MKYCLQLLLPRAGRGVRTHVLTLHEGAGPRASGPAVRAERRAALHAVAREQRLDLGHQLRRDLGLALANPPEPGQNVVARQPNLEDGLVRVRVRVTSPNRNRNPNRSPSPNPNPNTLTLTLTLFLLLCMYIIENNHKDNDHMLDVCLTEISLPEPFHYIDDYSLDSDMASKSDEPINLRYNT